MSRSKWVSSLLSGKMICCIVFLLLSYTFGERIPDVASQNVEDFGSDNNVTEQTETETVVPIAGNVNFGGLMKASGKVTILGSTEPDFDFPWMIPPMPSGGLFPDDDELLVFYDYPGSAYPPVDYGIPPYFTPIDPVHMVPTFAPIPYGGPMFEPIMSPLTQPHFIEVLEPIMSPTPIMSQPQFVEIFDPTMSSMFSQPQFIEIIEPDFGGHPIFEPFYSGYDMPFGPFNPHNQFMSPAHLEMIPVLVEFDVLDPMFSHMLEVPEYIISEPPKINAKRDTQLVPVSGKVSIVGHF